MLRAALGTDVPFIRRLVVDGADEGSFDPELASGSPAAALFFANLEQALATGYLRVPGADGSLSGEVHVAGYVYSPSTASPPIGFGLFRDLPGDGIELWLTGIASDARRQGHGGAMLRELLATPAGARTSVVRCNRRSPSAGAAIRLFRKLGFALARATPAMFWLVSAKASPELVEWILTFPLRDL